MLDLPELANLTLEEQVGQLFVVRTSGFTQDEDRRYPERELSLADLTQAIERYHIGGILLYGGEVGETSAKVQRFQAMSPQPLLVCADLEEGAGQHVRGCTRLPPALALAACGSQASAQAGLITAREARSVGVNWVLAPIADVNANPSNPVINVRAFGATPEQVTRESLAFLQGLQAGGVLTCAKHFPGHGDVDGDSHLELPMLQTTRLTLEREHWPPFQALIAAGVSAVMVAHLQAPALDVLPTSLSYPIVTDILQQQWGFEGLVVTDALTMGAIADRFGPAEAALMAFAAGADILLMPQDLPSAYQAILGAILQGRFSRERLYASVRKILRAKAQLKAAPPLPEGGWPEHHKQAQHLYRQSITTLGLGPLPDLKDTPHWCNILIAPKAVPVPGPVYHVHPETLVFAQDQAGEALAALPRDGRELVLVHLFLTTGPYRSYTQLPPALERFLTTAPQRLIVVSYGNPYLIQNVRRERILAYSPEAQQAVVDLLWGHYLAVGQLPIAGF